LLHRSLFKALVATALMLILAAGCAGSASRSKYYLLSASTLKAAAGNSAGTAGGLAIGLGPVSFPGYLDRQQIVVRTGPNEISFSEFDRWAEPLQANFIRVFKQNLATLLGTDTVFVHPFSPGAAFEFQVSAEVIRYDARPGDTAILAVNWTVSRIRDGEVVLNRQSSYEAPLAGSDYEDIVSAQSGLLAAFSRDVADALARIYRTEHGN
jgi:uncharacterized lipoprotein YmbA